MKRVDALFADYGSYHRARGNLACHAVGITLIVFGILSALQAIPVAGLWTASEVLVAAAGVFYLSLDVALGIAMLAVGCVLDLGARAVGDWRWGAVAFVLGWGFQGLGHGVFEKNSPAFLKNLLHLLVGPAYLVNEAVRIRPAGAGSE
jgi:uncharacterized membrane protein YGL010W